MTDFTSAMSGLESRVAETLRDLGANPALFPNGPLSEISNVHRTGPLHYSDHHQLLHQ